MGRERHLEQAFVAGKNFGNCEAVPPTAVSVSPANGAAGVAPGSADPRAEFNVFVGYGYAMDGENIRTRVSGNFFGVLPDGVTPYNTTELNPQAFQGGRGAACCRSWSAAGLRRAGQRAATCGRKAGSRRAICPCRAKLMASARIRSASCGAWNPVEFSAST